MFHHPMEPIGGFLVQYVNGEANLWIPTSSPTRDGSEIAHLSVSKRIKCACASLTSAAVSARKFDARAFCSAISVAQNRPAGALGSFGGGEFPGKLPSCRSVQSQIGIKADGTLTALDIDLVVEPVLTQPAGDRGTQFGDLGLGLLSHSACAHPWPMRLHQQSSRGSYARTGKIQTTWGIECTMDSVARQMGIDPYECVRKMFCFAAILLPRHASNGYGLSRPDGGSDHRHRLGWTANLDASKDAAANGGNGCADAAWHSACATARKAAAERMRW